MNEKQRGINEINKSFFEFISTLKDSENDQKKKEKKRNKITFPRIIKIIKKRMITNFLVIYSSI